LFESVIERSRQHSGLTKFDFLIIKKHNQTKD
jgi:hypothetical protein